MVEWNGSKTYKGSRGGHKGWWSRRRRHRGSVGGRVRSEERRIASLFVTRTRFPRKPQRRCPTSPTARRATAPLRLMSRSRTIAQRRWRRPAASPKCRDGDHGLPNRGRHRQGARAPTRRTRRSRTRRGGLAAPRTRSRLASGTRSRETLASAAARRRSSQSLQPYRRPVLGRRTLNLAVSTYRRETLAGLALRQLNTARAWPR